jgi:thioredoxin reductase (NADPH)
MLRERGQPQITPGAGRLKDWSLKMGTQFVVVNDDAQVLIKLEQDLAARYGPWYGVRTAASGQSGLDLLRNLRLRGDTVAMVLASNRMVVGDGSEFLASSRDLFPDARRLLLTTRAQAKLSGPATTQADVHQFVPAPWIPPEDRLFPFIDEFLPPLGSLPARPVMRVISDHTSGSDRELRRLLDNNFIPHKWLQFASREGAEIVDVARVRNSELPIVVLEDGEVLSAPTVRDMAQRVGLQVTPRSKHYDIVVVGGGIAGLTAAIYGASEGLSVVVLESIAPGGQVAGASSVRNYPGFPTGVAGAELAARARDQALEFGAEIVVLADVVGLGGATGSRSVHLADGSQVTGSAVVLATGVGARRTGIPEVERLVGRGVYDGLEPFPEELLERGGKVFVLGGGNSAGQAALRLAQFARSVTLLVRGTDLTRSMSEYLIDALNASPRVQVEFEVAVLGADGRDRLESLHLGTVRGDERVVDERVVAADALVTSFGSVPRTRWLVDTVGLDAAGFILTGGGVPFDEATVLPLETSLPGVFAVGDVRAGSIKRISTAAGDGATCIAIIHGWLAGQRSE